MLEIYQSPLACFFRKLAFIVLLCLETVSSQQIADTTFSYSCTRAYTDLKGPRVLIDAAHNNFHSMEDRYRPFAEVLRNDGYIVQSNDKPFNRARLASCDVLVIANALAQRNVDNWSLPTPSAFTHSEILVVRDWVKGGGSLFLIADHMPFPGAVDSLAKTFSIFFSNGFAVNGSDVKQPLVFTRGAGFLQVHPITEGLSASERIDSVVTFTGSAFRPSQNLQPILIFGSEAKALQTDTAWNFQHGGMIVPVIGWYQGAVCEFGKGRVAVFGEAAMFTAQLSGAEKQPSGMNAPGARQNAQLLLNVLHWLTRKIE